MRDLFSQICLLLTLRWKLAARAQARSSVTQIGVALALVAFMPAANAAGGVCYQRLQALPAEQSPDALVGVLQGMQGVWLALLLIAGAAGLTLSRPLPTNPLRLLPVRPIRTIGAAAIGSLFDLPLLLALPLLVAVARVFGEKQPLALAGIGVALTAFSVQTAASAQLLTQGGVWLRRQPVQRSLPPLLALGAALGAACALLPHLSPPGMAADAVVAAGRGHWGAGLLFLALQILVTAGWLWGAARLLAANQGIADGAGGWPSWGAQRSTGSATFDRAGWWGNDALFVAQSEWRLLVRDPGRHLALRWPAVMLLFGSFAWLAPDLGGDYLRNAIDLPAMGGVLYIVLWQLQLLCDRFGTESGTAALLFGFPISRRALILGRNLALLALLLLVDSLAFTLAFAAAQPATWIMLSIAAWLLPILLMVTAIGNVTSILRPFPLFARGERFMQEPEISGATTYLLTIVAAAGLIWGAGAVTDGAPPFAGPALGLVLAAAVYAASLPLTERLLRTREARLVRLLDGRW